MCKTCKKAVAARVAAEKEAGLYISRCRQPRLTDEQKVGREEHRKKYWRQYRKDNDERIRETKKQYRHRLRTEGVAAYGGKCSCCGEKQIEFLTLEHVGGRAVGERETSWHAWAKARKQGWPKKYTVLCFNCNCAKGIYGVCPHKKGAKSDLERKGTQDD